MFKPTMFSKNPQIDFSEMSIEELSDFVHKAYDISHEFGIRVSQTLLTRFEEITTPTMEDDIENTIRKTNDR